MAAVEAAVAEAAGAAAANPVEVAAAQVAEALSPPAPPAPAAQEAAEAPATVVAVEPAADEPAVAEAAGPSAAADGAGYGGDGAPARAQPPGRCAECRKKVGLATAFTCRCGLFFCSSHRLAEDHACTFDYRTVGRAALAAANPQVVASKLQKL